MRNLLKSSSKAFQSPSNCNAQLEEMSNVISTGVKYPPLTSTINDGLYLSGLGRTKLNQLIKDEKIRTIRVGKRRLIVYASLKAFLEQGDAK